MSSTVINFTNSWYSSSRKLIVSFKKHNKKTGFPVFLLYVLLTTSNKFFDTCSYNLVFFEKTYIFGRHPEDLRIYISLIGADIWDSISHFIYVFILFICSSCKYFIFSCCFISMQIKYFIFLNHRSVYLLYDICKILLQNLYTIRFIVFRGYIGAKYKYIDDTKHDKGEYKYSYNNSCKWLGFLWGLHLIFWNEIYTTNVVFFTIIASFLCRSVSTKIQISFFLKKDLHSLSF